MKILKIKTYPKKLNASYLHHIVFGSHITITLINKISSNKTIYEVYTTIMLNINNNLVWLQADHVVNHQS